MWVMRPDGSQRRNLTRDGSLNEYPSWSPDARSIAFGSHRDGQFEIYRMARDGSRQVNLTRSRAKDQWAAWSPDGRRIAFMSERDGSDGRLPDDSRLEAAFAMSRAPAPSTSRIPPGCPTVASLSRATRETGPIEVWVTRPDGSGARPLGIAAEPVFTYDWLGG